MAESSDLSKLLDCVLSLLLDGCMLMMSTPLKRAVHKAVEQAHGASEATVRCYDSDIKVQTSVTKMSGWDVSIDGFYVGSYYER
jgi:hypothetical protein